MNSIWRNLGYLNLKTLYFNFSMFPFKRAMQLPVFLSSNAKIKSMKGKVELPDKIKTGMIKIGASEIGHYDRKHNRPIWENKGKVIFKGEALIKFGAKIIVGETGVLEIGDKFRLSSGSYIICYKQVTLGNNCRISWDTQIIDTDFHRIFDENGKTLNPNKDIIMEDNCWIGNRCNINKGSRFKEYTIVASNSLTNKAYNQSHVILAGMPASITKTGVNWGGDISETEY